MSNEKAKVGSTPLSLNQILYKYCFSLTFKFEIYLLKHD